MSKLKELLTKKRKRPNIGKDKYYPTALEMIRCGIGANYSGEYFDEVYGKVLYPILKELDK